VECVGARDEEENFHYLTRLLKKLREIELTRQIERDMAEQAEKSRRSGVASCENDFRLPFGHIMNNEQFVHFRTIESKQLLND